MQESEKVIISIANYTGTDIHLSALSVKAGKVDIAMPKTIRRRYTDTFSVNVNPITGIDFNFLLHVGEIKYGAIQNYHHAYFVVKLPSNGTNIKPFTIDKVSDRFNDMFEIELDIPLNMPSPNYRINLYNKKT